LDTRSRMETMEDRERRRKDNLENSAGNIPEKVARVKRGGIKVQSKEDPKESPWIEGKDKKADVVVKSRKTGLMGPGGKVLKIKDRRALHRTLARIVAKQGQGLWVRPHEHVGIKTPDTDEQLRSVAPRNGKGTVLSRTHNLYRLGRLTQGAAERKKPSTLVSYWANSEQSGGTTDGGERRGRRGDRW